MLNKKLSVSKFLSWFGWVVINALGGALGVLVCAGIGIKNLDNDSAITRFALITAISVSTCQAIFIQKEYVSKQKTAIISQWIVISSFCSALMIRVAPIITFIGILGFISILPLLGSLKDRDNLFYGLVFLFFGLISGVITGFAQHFLLPGTVGESKRRWILYSGIGGGLGLGIGAVVVSILFKEPIIRLSGSSSTVQSLGMYGMTVFSTIGGIINGAVTGIEIVRLFGK